ncbi:hypothetical protein VNO77_20462 [Canavalia gladiata]|uniref:Uncharacterized protein n=1 Tax=Canavalia gladiata TaxID=3824 RepID=A0AAN9LP99_CANGL
MVTAWLIYHNLLEVLRLDCPVSEQAEVSNNQRYDASVIKFSVPAFPGAIMVNINRWPWSVLDSVLKERKMLIQLETSYLFDQFSPCQSCGGDELPSYLPCAELCLRFMRAHRDISGIGENDFSAAPPRVSKGHVPGSQELIHIDSSSSHVSATAPRVHHSQAMVMLILGLMLVLTQTNGNLLNNLLCELGQLCREPEFAKCYFDESFVVPSLLISLVFSFSHPNPRSWLRSSPEALFQNSANTHSPWPFPNYKPALTWSLIRKLPRYVSLHSQIPKIPLTFQEMPNRSLIRKLPRYPC